MGLAAHAQEAQQRADWVLEGGRLGWCPLGCEPGIAMDAPGSPLCFSSAQWSVWDRLPPL